MALFDHVLIVGTGFMGNALANAFYNNGIAGTITGVEPNPAYRRQAMANGCYNSVVETISELKRADSTSSFSAESVDLVVVCSPVETVPVVIVDALRRLSKPLVIDIASVKAPILEGVQEITGELPGRFIACHPISGSDRSGPIRPPASIFTDRACVICPHSANSESDLQRIEALWTRLGSRVERLDADHHDQILGMTSHMPHAVASALSAALDQEELEYCGTGIRDTIRIARSNPLLWEQIFVHNRDSVLAALDRFQQTLDKLRRALESGDSDALVKILEQGQKNRDALGN